MPRKANLIFLSIPGLRSCDLPLMPRLNRMMPAARLARINHSFPCVTWPSQATMLTGETASGHGVIANGFYWRDKNQVEMWTAGNHVIQSPQIWDILPGIDSSLTSAAWFPMLSKGCGANYVCMPAPIHRADGSEQLWCYTKPQEYYGELLQAFGHFPLQHFWGPMANIKSSAWIADSAIAAAARFKPNFFYIYLPHLDYAAQKCGPDSAEARQAVTDLDHLLGRLFDELPRSYQIDLIWIIASEYVITPVNHVSYPNRLLRNAGMLIVDRQADGEHLDLTFSQAWALVDHQFAHVFVKDSNDRVIKEIKKLFDGQPGIDRVVTGRQRAELNLDHNRSGDVVLVAAPGSWMAYYWWLDDALAPAFARTVDIHRKPGYDPVELHFDFQTKSIPLDATLVRGSHGAPVSKDEQKGVFLLANCPVDSIEGDEISDVDILPLVLRVFEARN